MSVKTIYKCDKCGSEQETYEQFWNLGVVAYSHGRRLDPYNPFVSSEHKMQVCRSCLESYGIHVMKGKEREPVITPTLEDIIIDIVHETLDSRD